MNSTMLNGLSKHPSNIAKSAVEYLQALNLSKKTKRIHEDVLFFFMESLLSDLSAVIETKEGEFVLSDNWDAYYGGVIKNFVDWWLPRKVMDDTLQLKAPGVLRKWLKWCYQHDYFDKERYQEFLEALPRGKAKETKRLQEAGKVLYRIHTPDPGSWLTGDYKKVIPISHKKEPEEWEEGCMKVVKLEKQSGYFETYEDRTIGPVVLGKELVKLLRIGDVLNVTIGKHGKSWRVLESGNVYPEGAIF